MTRSVVSQGVVGGGQGGALRVRLTTEEDLPLLKSWLFDPQILQWFPMCDEREVDDAVRSWLHYIQMGAALTVEKERIPCGAANLYIQNFDKIRHQALFCIIVASDYRGQGVGSFLLDELIQHAKKQFGIELLHLEVYDGNPAIHLYQRLGFTEYARHRHFIWDEGRYFTKIMMQKKLDDR